MERLLFHQNDIKRPKDKIEDLLAQALSNLVFGLSKHFSLLIKFYMPNFGFFYDKQLFKI